MPIFGGGPGGLGIGGGPPGLAPINGGGGSKLGGGLFVPGGGLFVIEGGGGWGVCNGGTNGSIVIVFSEDGIALLTGLGGG